MSKNTYINQQEVIELNRIHEFTAEQQIAYKLDNMFKLYMKRELRWKTKVGQQIPIQYLDTAHLHRIVNLFGDTTLSAVDFRLSFIRLEIVNRELNESL